MRNKLAKRAKAGLLIGVLSMSIAACGSAESKTADVGFYTQTSLKSNSVAMDSASYDGEIFYEMEMTQGAYEPAASPVTNSAGSSVISTAYGQSNQKLIRTKSIKAETKEFDEAVNAINAKVMELSGYIQSSSVSGTGKGYDMRSVNMTIRIPAQNMDTFVQVVESSISVLSATESARDVTLSYVDMESHVKALRTEQEALMKLLEKAEALEDIIRIQSQLTQVRYEIESYESSLRTLDNQVNYATVELNIREVIEETPVLEERSFGDEVIYGLNQNLHAIGLWLRNFGIWFLTSIPYLIIWAVIIAAGVVIVRKIIRKIIRKNKAKKAVDSGFDEKDKEGE